MKGDQISGENQLSRMSEIFGPPFWILILKVLWTKIFCHSLDFNAILMIQDYFPQDLQISTN